MSVFIGVKDFLNMFGRERRFCFGFSFGGSCFLLFVSLNMTKMRTSHYAMNMMANYARDKVKKQNRNGYRGLLGNYRWTPLGLYTGLQQIMNIWDDFDQNLYLSMPISFQMHSPRGLFKTNWSIRFLVGHAWLWLWNEFSLKQFQNCEKLFWRAKGPWSVRRTHFFVGQ